MTSAETAATNTASNAAVPADDVDGVLATLAPDDQPSTSNTDPRGTEQ